MKTPFGSFWSAFLLIAFLFVGCSEDEDPPAPKQDNDPVATKIKLLGALPQTAMHLDTVETPYQVLVTDQNGDPFPGAKVKFTALQGSFLTADTITNSDGKASAVWILGSYIGWQAIRISAFDADGNAIEGSPIQVAINAKATDLQIGDYHEGGIIYYLDFVAEHGYVVSISDLDTAAPWCNSASPTTGADGTVLGTGMQNTADIIASCGMDNAAGIADAFSENGFDDWYLPSKEALIDIYHNREKINAGALANGGTEFSLAKYWASSEFDVGMGDKGYSLDFSTGNTIGVVKTDSLRVRAVRAF